MWSTLACYSAGDRHAEGAEPASPAQRLLSLKIGTTPKFACLAFCRLAPSPWLHRGTSSYPI